MQEVTLSFSELNVSEKVSKKVTETIKEEDEWILLNDKPKRKRYVIHIGSYDKVMVHSSVVPVQVKPNALRFSLSFRSKT